LEIRPNDAEAKALLTSITQDAAAKMQSGSASAAPPLPLERIKRNYDENAFRQLALDVQNAEEARLVPMDARQHAAFHVARGRELLAKGFTAEAEKEFREALQLDSSIPGAHAGMAGVLEAANNHATARTEAQAELAIQPSAEAHALLGQIALRQNDQQAAAAELDQALRLDPSNPAVQSLKQALAGQALQRVNSPARP
jgi:Tfp pilus assembly protein PilF